MRNVNAAARHRSRTGCANPSSEWAALKAGRPVPTFGLSCAHTMARPPVLARIARVLLTDDTRLRPSLAVTLTSLLTYVLYSGLGAVQVALGTMALPWLVGGSLSGIAIST